METEWGQDCRLKIVIWGRRTQALVAQAETHAGAINLADGLLAGYRCGLFDG